MKKTLAFAAVALAVLAAADVPTAPPRPSSVRPAPAFTLTDKHGKSHSLAGLAGKVVVLEWWNPECPFVGSTTRAATCRSCRRSGRRKASCG